MPQYGLKLMQYYASVVNQREPSLNATAEDVTQIYDTPSRQLLSALHLDHPKAAVIALSTEGEGRKILRHVALFVDEDSPRSGTTESDAATLDSLVVLQGYIDAMTETVVSDQL